MKHNILFEDVDICIVNRKKKLIKELEILGIDKTEIYIEMDDVEDYIKTHIDDM